MPRLDGGSMWIHSSYTTKPEKFGWFCIENTCHTTSLCHKPAGPWSQGAVEEKSQVPWILHTNPGAVVFPFRGVSWVFSWVCGCSLCFEGVLPECAVEHPSIPQLWAGPPSSCLSACPWVKTESGCRPMSESWFTWSHGKSQKLYIFPTVCRCLWISGMQSSVEIRHDVPLPGRDDKKSLSWWFPYITQSSVCCI